MPTKPHTPAKTHTPAPSYSDTFNLAGLAEAIHNGTGATGRQLTQDTLAAAAALAYAFGKNEAGDYFATRAKELWGGASRPYSCQLHPLCRRCPDQAQGYFRRLSI